MNPTGEELWGRLSEARGLPYGAARIAAFEHLLRHTDAAGDRELAFEVRMGATVAYVHGGEPGKSFVTFAWCLSDFDNDPAEFHARWQRSLLWHFKYMVSALLKFPEVPLARTYAVLDDMERRYRAAGEDNMQPVYKDRHHVAAHIGDEAGADAWYERWVTAPRSRLSDCRGCDPSSRIYHLAGRGRDEEAIAIGESALAGSFTCSEQPQGILGNLIVPYLRSGRADDAADAHLRSYQVFRRTLADMTDVAEAIELCARTGNEHRGLEILQRHLGWQPKAPSPAADMYFSAAAALLLRRLDDLGHGDATLRREGAEVPAGELRAEMSARALEIARRFDARNGTTARSDAMAGVLEAEPFDVPMPLTGRRGAEPAKKPLLGLIADIAQLEERFKEVQSRHEAALSRVSAAVRRGESPAEAKARFEVIDAELTATSTDVLRALTGVPERLDALHAPDRALGAAFLQAQMMIRSGHPEQALEHLRGLRPRLPDHWLWQSAKLTEEAELEITLKAE